MNVRELSNDELVDEILLQDPDVVEIHAELRRRLVLLTRIKDAAEGVLPFVGYDCHGEGDRPAASLDALLAEWREEANNGE